MKKILLVTVVFLSCFLPMGVSAAGAIDSVGFSVAPLTSYNKSGLSDGTYPTSFFLVGPDSSWRLEYMNFKPNSHSDQATIESLVYDNTALLLFYNLEFLLRARRGTLLGRTRLFVGFGGGLFRSRVNDSLANSEFNPGFGGLGGFRYFFDKQVYFGGEAKYFSAPIIYQNSEFEKIDIGGLFLTFMVGFRFSD